MRLWRLLRRDDIAPVKHGRAWREPRRCRRERWARHSRQPADGEDECCPHTKRTNCLIWIIFSTVPLCAASGVALTIVSTIAGYSQEMAALLVIPAAPAVLGFILYVCIYGAFVTSRWAKRGL
jgi:hypothetical protein